MVFAIAGAPSGLSAQGVAESSHPTPPNPATDAQILSSYEGQNVTEIEVTGRPQSSAAEFEPLFAQKAAEPFSTDRVNSTLAALKASGKAQNVRVEVDAEADGVRVLFMLEPAVYFGLFQLFAAGAGGQFSGADAFQCGRRRKGPAGIDHILSATGVF